MIMPTKHVAPRDALLGVGGRLLPLLARPRTVPALWHAARETASVESYGRFVLALDLLYLMGVVEFRNGLIQRVEG
jgi:hypothetical protein